MDKQMQIEDLTALIDSFNIRTIRQAKYVAEYIVDKLNYRKIHKNAVVLTREEYEWLTCCFGKFEEIMNDIKEQSRKETAEKYHAEMVKAIESVPNATKEFVQAWKAKNDEICKEITKKGV